eukprot:1393297-Pleurochrysis_carterae.AAC.2
MFIGNLAACTSGPSGDYMLTSLRKLFFRRVFARTGARASTRVREPAVLPTRRHARKCAGAITPHALTAVCPVRSLAALSPL